MSSMAGQQANEEDNVTLSLPTENGWGAVPYLYLYQDFWCPSTFFQAACKFQNYFQAKDSDVFVASFPKSGTTWLKALTFAIANHQNFSLENHPLLTSNSHDLVPSFEINLTCDVRNLSNMTEPRIFGTHVPFPSLPKSILETNCRIIYICRNPFDTFVSAWIFFSKNKSVSLPALTLEEAFEKYCKGIIPFGPWWSHMLGYWKESIAKPNKVMFLKYEDLIEDPNFHVKSVAEFLGCSFTEEDESNGVIESIIKLCSFEKMKGLEVNKFGKQKTFDYKNLFRKAEIGDWVNYFSPSMIEKLSKIIEEKLSGLGLSFNMHSY